MTIRLIAFLSLEQFSPLNLLVIDAEFQFFLFSFYLLGGAIRYTRRRLLFRLSTTIMDEAFYSTRSRKSKWPSHFLFRECRSRIRSGGAPLIDSRQLERGATNPFSSNFAELKARVAIFSLMM